ENDAGLIRTPEEGWKGGEEKPQIQDQKPEAGLKAKAEKHVREAIGTNKEMIKLFERSLKTGVGEWEVTDHLSESDDPTAAQAYQYLIRSQRPGNRREMEM